MSNTLMHDVSKHIDLINPANHEMERLHLIGCGAVGSAIGILFAKLGVRTYLQDFDSVEAHNLANQVAFWHDSVGMEKARALSHAMHEHGRGPDAFNCQRFEHDEYNSHQVKGTMLAVCVDTMEARREIWKSLRYNTAHWLVDTRVTAHMLVVLGVNLDASIMRRRYEGTLALRDEDVDEERAACGRIIGMIDVATIAAGVATRMTVQHMRSHLACTGETPPFQFTLDLRTFESSVSR